MIFLSESREKYIARLSSADTFILSLCHLISRPEINLVSGRGQKRALVAVFFWFVWPLRNTSAKRAENYLHRTSGIKWIGQTVNEVTREELGIAWNFVNRMVLLWEGKVRHKMLEFLKCIQVVPAPSKICSLEAKVNTSVLNIWRRIQQSIKFKTFFIEITQ